MPRRCGREPALHRRARRRGVLGEGAERVDAPVEQIPHRATQLEVAPGQRERQISDGIIGQATGDVLLVSAEPLPPDIARVHSGRQRQARLVPPVTKDRDREPRIDAVARHHRELVARRHRLTGGVARGGERSGRLEAGSRVAVVRVRPDTRRALPLERELHAATARRADILEVAAGDGRGDEEDVVPHVGAVHVGADVEVARRADVPSQLVRRGHNGLQGGVGSEGERQRASGLWVGARQLDDRGSAEPAAHGREHLVSAPAIPGEPGARRESPENVEAVLRRIDQVLERHPDPVVARRGGRGEPRHHLQVHAGEGPRVHLIGAHRLRERIGRAAPRHGKDVDGHVLVVRVRPGEPVQLSGPERHLARELHRPAAHARRVLLPRVFSHEVRVELLARERAPERIQGELRVAEQALRVQDDEVGLRGEVVTPGEVATRIHRRHALGKAAGLEDLVVRPRIAERGVPGAGQEPELREQRADPAARVLTPAALPLVACAHVVVPHPMAGPGARLQLVAPPASRRRLDSPRRWARAAAGHEVHRGPEGVPTEQHRGAVHHFHPLHVLERQQVEVHLVGVGLVGAHAVHIHRHALRHADHGRDLKPAEGDVHLCRRAELVRRGHAR